jgi:hypothetical protein
MLCREIIDVYYENHREHRNIARGQNMELYKNVTAGYIYRCVLKVN